MTVTDRSVDQTSIKAPAGGRLRRWMAAAGAWVEDRTGLLAPIRGFLLYPVPAFVHKNILYSLGGLSLISIILQMFTGILLVFYYEPTPVGAYDSVDFITYQMPLGWLVRGLHLYNASVLVILIFLHLLHTFFNSAYKRPREITWLSGLVMFLLTLGIAFTGALLPWDQEGYWATKVGTEIAASLPLLGPWAAALLRGGGILGQATLSRFFVIHTMLLPLAVLLLIALHLQQLRRHGIAPPVTRRAQALARKFVPFYPHWVTLDGALGVGLLALLIGWSYLRRAPLEFIADPSSTEFIPRPEWYFLFLYQSLKYFPGPLEPVAAFLIPAIIIGSAVLLPFVDRGEERRPWRKPRTTLIGGVIIAWIVIMTLAALFAP